MLTNLKIYRKAGLFIYEKFRDKINHQVLKQTEGQLLDQVWRQFENDIGYISDMPIENYIWTELNAFLIKLREG